MIKTVGELIEELEQYDTDCKVQLLQQPNHPQGFAIRELRQEMIGDDEPESVIYIVEGKYISSAHLTEN